MLCTHSKIVRIVSLRGMSILWECVLRLQTEAQYSAEQIFERSTLLGVYAFSAFVKRFLPTLAFQHHFIFACIFGRIFAVYSVGLPRATSVSLFTKNFTKLKKRTVKID